MPIFGFRVLSAKSKFLLLPNHAYRERDRSLA